MGPNELFGGFPVEPEPSRTAEPISITADQIAAAPFFSGRLDTTSVGAAVAKARRRHALLAAAAAILWVLAWATTAALIGYVVNLEARVTVLENLLRE